MAETTYQNLVKGKSKKCESVHLEVYPDSYPKLIKPELEKAVRVMETLVLLGRQYREKIGVKAKIPLRSPQNYSPGSRSAEEFEAV